MSNLILIRFVLSYVGRAVGRVTLFRPRVVLIVRGGHLESKGVFIDTPWFCNSDVVISKVVNQCPALGIPMVQPSGQIL